LTSRSLVLLSGEGTSLPEAEARALFLAYDPGSRFERPERRLLVAESRADPEVIASRVAFARRVGRMVDNPSDASRLLKGKRIRLRNFDLVSKPALNPSHFLRGFDVQVDLENPEVELTLVRGVADYLAITSPGMMRQEWSLRRPRVRAFFHPSAIFPKLARALVNMSRVREGQVFLDPFAGTGSLPLEGALVGARVVANDRAEKMVKGSMANMRRFGQQWLGVVRSDALRLPLRGVDAIATDVPYGRASSTMGAGGMEVLRGALTSLPGLLAAGSRMVVMHSKDDPVDGSRELELEEEHDLQVHKKLTRRISVLRRR
jgi:16S rRNA G966 N2-methylase RsmD